MTARLEPQFQRGCCFSRIAWLLLFATLGLLSCKTVITRAACATRSKSRSNSPPSLFYILDPQDYRSYFPDEASFRTASEVAPFLDLPLHHERFHHIQVAYYYRIRSYRKHIVKYASNNNNSNSKDYWVVTEFLPSVPWAGPGNTISAAAGHHILEGRWFWDAPEFLDDYIRFWYLGGEGDDKHVNSNNANANNDTSSGGKRKGSSPQQPQPQPQPQPHIARYTNWIYHAAWQYGLLWDIENNNATLALLQDTFDNAATIFREKYVEKYWTLSDTNSPVWNTTDRLCWTQDDGYDAMEVSVSGGGCRPTIASAMWGEAMALVHAGRLLGKDEKVVQLFLEWADLSRDIVTQQHWNPTIDSFAVIPPPTKRSSPSHALRKSPEYNHDIQQLPAGCDLQKIRVPNQTVNVRELLAFMPWYYSSLLSRNDPRASDWARQFRFLLQSSGEEGFANAAWGLRTVQQSNACYNYSWDHGDCWNGPSWPYETSRVLTGLANLLVDHYDKARTIEASGMNSEEFQRLFQQYALQHTLTTAVNDTARPLFTGHIFENVHPDEGYWNNRERKYWQNDTNKDMGDDYNHSTFLDLVLSSWLGIRMPNHPTSSASSVDSPSDTINKSPWLVVHPLIRAPYFAADRIPYQGRVLSIMYDPDGSRYSIQDSFANVVTGLAIFIDGRVVAQQPNLGRLEVLLEPSTNGDLSVNVARA